MPSSSSASAGLTDYFQVDTLGSWYKSIISGVKRARPLQKNKVCTTPRHPCSTMASVGEIHGGRDAETDLVAEAVEPNDGRRMHSLRWDGDRGCHLRHPRWSGARPAFNSGDENQEEPPATGGHGRLVSAAGKGAQPARRPRAYCHRLRRSPKSVQPRRGTARTEKATSECSVYHLKGRLVRRHEAARKIVRVALVPAGDARARFLAGGALV